ncbi:ATPase, T2SS/T4P/T4SS family [Stutzerimonas stutzeri]|uniref:ATPase, T2SS/T4P/T4SS family n=1 Tax=Stutzerimonas stutzeri TaxID=316 RepID=A0ABD4XWD5_STUST|nr:ATPase, T2SS/T4P/T4SS family [Stutzerimonas stutzeri]MDH0686998.1 ATPase, T2SS/T4P/T4SS family [Stutzerimonas stutzeri]
MTEGQNEDLAREFLTNWGWGGDAPEPVRQFALKVAKVNPKGDVRVGDIVVALGYLTKEQVENPKDSPQPREPFFQFLARVYPQVRKHEAEVMAIKDRLPYYAKLPETLAVHPLVASEPIRNECEAIAGLLVSMPTGDNCLVFSSYEEMLRYRQRGASETAASALAKGLHTEARALRFGFAPRVEVATPLRAARKDNGGSEGGHNVGRLFYADRTRGTERNIAVDMLETGVARKATDLSLRVLETGEGEIFYRENGVRLHSYRISLQERIEVTNFLLQTTGANASGTRLMKPSTGRLFYRGQTNTYEMRCSFIPGDMRSAFNDDDQMVSISARYLEQEDGDGFVDIDKLSFVPKVKEHLISALNVKRGIILLVGPTNSGKSTTLAAFLGQHYLIFGDTVKRLSLEDPKERSLIGVEQFSLPSADVYEPYLEGFLRHDPDVILLSEIRSRASAEVATRAALTGHLVLSTFHASEPVEGYTSLAHLLSEERQHDLLQALVMIITQRLVPKLCPVCSVQRAPEPSEWAKFRYSMALRGMDVDEMSIDKSKIRFPVTTREKPDHKCDRCAGTGYVGVYPVHGILDFTKDVKALLRAGEFDKAAERQAFTLECQAIDALHEGLIDLTGVST